MAKFKSSKKSQETEKINFQNNAPSEKKQEKEAGLTFQDVFERIWVKSYRQTTAEEKEALIATVFRGGWRGLIEYVKFRGSINARLLSVWHWIFILLVFIFTGGYMLEIALMFPDVIFELNRKHYVGTVILTNKIKNQVPITYIGSVERGEKIQYDGLTTTTAFRYDPICILTGDYYDPGEISSVIRTVIHNRLLDLYFKSYPDCEAGVTWRRQIGDSLYVETIKYAMLSDPNTEVSALDAIDTVASEIIEKFDAIIYLPVEEQTFKVEDKKRYLYVVPNVKFYIDELRLERKVKGYYKKVWVIFKKFVPIEKETPVVTFYTWGYLYNDTLTYRFTVFKPIF